MRVDEFELANRTDQLNQALRSNIVTQWCAIATLAAATHPAAKVYAIGRRRNGRLGSFRSLRHAPCERLSPSCPAANRLASSAWTPPRHAGRRRSRTRRTKLLRIASFRLEVPPYLRDADGDGRVVLFWVRGRDCRPDGPGLSAAKRPPMPWGRTIPKFAIGRARAGSGLRPAAAQSGPQAPVLTSKTGRAASGQSDCSSRL
jgi:hypothetical protein